VDEAEVTQWFKTYFDDFVRLGRGDLTDVQQILTYYGVPLLVSTDDSSVVLTEDAQVVGMMQRQVDSLREAGFDHTDELESETTVLNRTCALHRGHFSRVRADGTEITRFGATYLITETPAGRRITALALHTPD
jgi:hypothetical protein